MRNSILLPLFCLILSTGCAQNKSSEDRNNPVPEKERVQKTASEWKAQLTDLEYNVLREKGTERAFSGELNTEKRKGKFVCKGCGHDLFSSETKFDSGTGWPSFYKIDNPIGVGEVVDNSYGMARTEVLCNYCGGHLGHVFNDGPAPTGLRYCINSASLDFVPTKK